MQIIEDFKQISPPAFQNVCQCLVISAYIDMAAQVSSDWEIDLVDSEKNEMSSLHFVICVSAVSYVLSYMAISLSVWQHFQHNMTHDNLMLHLKYDTTIWQELPDLIIFRFA